MAVTFIAHGINASTVRLYFDARIKDNSAANLFSNYVLTSLAPPLTAVVPSVASIEFEDEFRQAILVKYDASLTYNKLYSINVTNLVADDGTVVTISAFNFTSNVQDPPLVLRSVLSVRTNIDIIFDRSIGPTSSAPVASIRPSGTVGPGVLLTPVAWNPSIPETNLRFILNPAMVTADGHEIVFSNIIDSSLNVGSGVVPLTLFYRVTDLPTYPVPYPPYSYAELTQVQITDAYVDYVTNSSLVIPEATIKVFFNCWLDQTQSENTANWSIYQYGAHNYLVNDQVVFTFTSPTNLGEVITSLTEFKTDFNAHLTRVGVHPINDNAPPTVSGIVSLVNDLKAKYNAHRTQAGVHSLNDAVNIVDVVDLQNAFNLSTSITFLNDIKAKYNAHRTQVGVHTINDVNNVVSTPNASDLNSAALLADDLKNRFENHRDSVFGSGFYHAIADNSNTITASYTLPYIISQNPVNLTTSISLLNEAQHKYLTHIMKTGVHLYSDNVNIYAFTKVADGNLILTESVITNELIPSYSTGLSGHLTFIYSQNVNSVSYVQSEQNDSYSVYCEVKTKFIQNASVVPNFLCSVTTQSSDLLSTTNQLTYTGTMSNARSVTTPAKILWSSPTGDSSVSMVFDREIINPNSISITNPSNSPSTSSNLRLNSTLGTLLTCFNDLIEGYTAHRSSSIHSIPGGDTYNTFAFTASLPLSSIITLMNNYKTTFNNHILSVRPTGTDDYHYNLDFAVTTPNATDFNSAVVLLQSLRKAFLSHIGSSIFHFSPSPTSMISAKLFDTIDMDFSPMKNGEIYDLQMSINDVTFDAFGNKHSNLVKVNQNFIGLSTNPSLASAIPKSGLQLVEDSSVEGVNISFVPDSVETWFSKPMNQKELSSSNFSISGGILLKNFIWETDQKISIQVVNMDPISYTMTVIGLTDQSGNLILP